MLPTFCLELFQVNNLPFKFIIIGIMKIQPVHSNPMKSQCPGSVCTQTANRCSQHPLIFAFVLVLKEGRQHLSATLVLLLNFCVHVLWLVESRSHLLSCRELDNKIDAGLKRRRQYMRLLK